MDLTPYFLDFALLGAGWVLWLLVALSVVSIGIMIERALWFSSRDTDTEPMRVAPVPWALVADRRDPLALLHLVRLQRLRERAQRERAGGEFTADAARGVRSRQRHVGIGDPQLRTGRGFAGRVEYQQVERAGGDHERVLDRRLAQHRHGVARAQRDRQRLVVLVRDEQAQRARGPAQHQADRSGGGTAEGPGGAAGAEPDLFGDREDLAPGRVGNAGLAIERVGDGHLRDAGPLGDVGDGGSARAPSNAALATARAEGTRAAASSATASPVGTGRPRLTGGPSPAPASVAAPRPG